MIIHIDDDAYSWLKAIRDEVKQKGIEVTYSDILKALRSMIREEGR